MKGFCLCKTSLMKEKNLFVENVPHEGKIFVCEKLPRSRKYFYEKLP